MDGIKNKLDKTKLLLYDNKPDVLALIDTAISSDPLKHNFLADEALVVEGYTFVRQDNVSEKKGGIIVYVKEYIIIEEDTHINKLSADFK